MSLGRARCTLRGGKSDVSRADRTGQRLGASLSRKWIESAPRGISFRLGNLAEVGPPGSFGISFPDRERGRAESLAARGDDRLSSSWIQEARRELVALCGHSAAWGYRRGHRPSVEPTALACLGLLASVPGDVSAVDLETTQKAADWMQAIQQSDGSLPVSEGSTSPGWATPYGLMLWGNFTGKEEARRRARAWLLGNEGVRLDLSNQTDRVVGHDPSLVGWPWVAGTHSWLEPTALAILALRRDGLHNHPRITAGIELILDRALEAGGWNYGNKSVFGTELRPQPGPTGLALLALASSGEESRVGLRGSGLPAPNTPGHRGAGFAWLGHPWPSGSPRLSHRSRNVAGSILRRLYRQARRRHGTCTAVLASQRAYAGPGHHARMKAADRRHLQKKLD